MDLEANKRALRRRVNERRAGVSSTDALAAERGVIRLLFEAFDFQAFGADRRVGLYAALPDELPTRRLFDALRDAPVVCCLPNVRSDGGLDFTRVDRWESLQPGAFGVLSPDPALSKLQLGDGDVVLVPGTAFDLGGGRLGRGRGYYDRAFPVGVSGAPDLIGVAYQWQIEEMVPTTSHDRAMDAIVTEHGFHRVLGEPR
jgi:5-formyltetrahydrofolate cyclo-ligase